MTGYAFVLLAAAANWGDFWAESYAFGRTLTPLLLLLALGAFRQRGIGLAMPIALVIPRVTLQLAPLAYSVIQGAGAQLQKAW